MTINTIVPLILCVLSIGLLVAASYAIIVYTEKAFPLIFMSVIVTVATGARACCAAWEDTHGRNQP